MLFLLLMLSAAPFAAAEKYTTPLPQKDVDPWEESGGGSGLEGCDVTDDHADDPLCATPLVPGEDMPGVIDDAKDGDYFVFAVSGGSTTVAVDVDGPVFGILYDENGQALGSWSDGRFVRVLAPGRYDVRVTSAGTWNVGYAVAVSEASLP